MKCGIMQVSIEDIPSDFADYFSITEASAQVLLSVVAFLAILLPVLLVSKGRNPITVLVATFLTLALLTGIGWLPFWMLIATIALIALGISYLGTGIIFGDSKGGGD